jgi:hypothetical protein
MHGRPFYAWKEVLRLEGRLPGRLQMRIDMGLRQMYKEPDSTVLDVASRTISRKVISISQQSQTTYSTN